MVDFPLRLDVDLAVIVPSRGRPGNIARLADAFRETGADEVAQLLVAVDDDDPELPEYRRVFEACAVDTLVVGPRQGLPGWTNLLAAGGLGAADEVFAMASMGDDHVPRTHGWAQRFLAELRAMGSGFVYGNDGLQGERLPTAVAVTSDVVRALGWMCQPTLEHLYIDNSWLELGRAMGRLRYLPEVVLEHMHPDAGKARQDQTYREANASDRARRDQAAFELWRRDGLPRDLELLRAAGIC